MGRLSDKAERTHALKSSPTAKLALGAAITLMGKLVASPIRFLVPVLLARSLGPEAFGLYTIGLTLLGFVEAIAPLGLDRGVTRLAAPHVKPEEAGRLNSVVAQALGLAGLAGLLTGAFFFLGSGWLADQVFHKPSLALVLRLLALAFPSVTVNVVAVAATRISQRMEFAVYVNDLCLPLVNLLLVAATVVFHWGLMGSVTAVATAYVAGSALALYYVWRLYPRVFSFGPPLTYVVRRLLAFSLPASLSGISVLFISRLDRIAVGYFGTETETGIYQAAAFFSIFFEFVLTAFLAILAPMMAELDGHRDMARLRELYQVGSKWSLYLVVPACLVVCVIPYEILTVVFGRAYIAAGLPLVILVLGQLINATSGVTGTLLVMTGRQRRWMVLTVVALLTDLGLIVLWVPHWKGVGAALSATVALGVLYVASTLEARRVLGYWPYDRRYLKGGLAAVVTWAGLSGWHSWYPLAPWLAIVSAILISLAMFWGTLLLLGWDAEDREFIHLARTYLQTFRQRV